MATMMAHPAGQDPAHRGPVSVVAAQTLGIKDKANRVVIANNLVKVTSSISQDTKAIQSSLIVVSIMSSTRVSASEIRRFINVRSMQLSRRFLNICGGQNIQSHGVERITRPVLIIRVS